MILGFPELLPWSIQSRIIPEPMSGCWLWTGAHFPRMGYGAVSLKFQGHYGPHTVHRLVYRICTGSDPSELLCHTCNNKSCCNPHHLYLGNHRSNLMDAIALGSWTPWNRGKELCIRGHPLSGDNLKIDARGHRVCRSCKRQGQIQRRKMRKESK